MERDNRTIEGQWKGIVRTIHNGEEQWERTKDWRDKELEDNGEWGQRNNGDKGTKDMEQWGQKGIVG